MWARGQGAHPALLIVATVVRSVEAARGTAGPWQGRSSRLPGPARAAGWRNRGSRPGRGPRQAGQRGHRPLAPAGSSAADPVGRRAPALLEPQKHGWQQGLRGSERGEAGDRRAGATGGLRDGGQGPGFSCRRRGLQGARHAVSSLQSQWAQPRPPAQVWHGRHGRLCRPCPPNPRSGLHSALHFSRSIGVKR